LEVQGTVRALLIVTDSVLFEQYPCFVDAGEEFSVEKFVTQAAIEALGGE
jgi:hypothetical protein